MPDGLDELLLRAGGAASRRLLVGGGVSRNLIDAEVRSGRLAAPFPSAYCRPWDLDDPDVLERAAQMSVGRPSALSHLSALRRRGLVEYYGPVHVTVPFTRSPRGGPGLVVHRTRCRTPIVRIDGIAVVAPAYALVGSWPLLPVTDRRGPVIDAVRRGVVRTPALRAAVDTASRLPGRRELIELIGLLDAGCESELEIWGHREVFAGPGLDHGIAQYRLHLAGRQVRLDLAYEQERLAVEMDGMRWHLSREQRERDMLRDAALAAAGWVTLRFSHRRLHLDIAGCRRDTLAALAARRR